MGCGLISFYSVLIYFTQGYVSDNLYGLNALYSLMLVAIFSKNLPNIYRKLRTWATNVSR